MQFFRGYQHPGLAPACALTIGNFDGVHRGHQAMLALLRSEAQQRGVPSCVLTFEPHPRDYFALQLQRPELAPSRVGTFRDKLQELAQCGVDQTVVLPFNAALAGQSPQDFVEKVLVQGLGARYVLVGDDFRFGARRTGDYAMLDATGEAHGFDVARMNSYEVHGLRVSSSAVRTALADGNMAQAARLLRRQRAGHAVAPDVPALVAHERGLAGHGGDGEVCFHVCIYVCFSMNSRRPLTHAPGRAGMGCWPYL
jgi:riboflavin kinase/FMN adenylyltransferase